MRHTHNRGLKRICALALSALLSISQLAAPVLALALTEAELPIVTLYYQTAEDSGVLPLAVMPAITGEQAVYWATLPQEALNWQITVDVSAPVFDESLSFSPASGTALDPSMLANDLAGLSTPIEVYRNGEWQASYPLYLSTVPMPEPVAVNGYVTIYYINSQTNETLITDGRELPPGEYTITPDRAGELTQFTVNEPSYQDVSVAADGSTYPAEAYFFFTPVEEPQQPINARVYVYYVDADNGATLIDDSRDYTEANTYTISPERVGELADYQLIEGGATDVTVYEDGTVSIETVVFTMKHIEQPPQEPVKVPVAVYYVDADWNTLLDDSREYEPGTYYIEPTRAGELVDYELVDGTPAEVTVYEDGTVSRDTVFFLMAVKSVPVEPDPVTPVEPDPVTPVEPDPVTPVEPDPVTPVEPSEPTLSQIDRFATTNKTVNFRSQPDKSSEKAFANVKSDSLLWVYGGLDTNGDGSADWLSIRYNEVDCYVMAEYIDVMSQEDSDKVLYANAKPAEVTVYYVDEAKQEAFYQYTESCPANNITKIDVKLENAVGYTLTGEPSAIVTVDVNSVPDQPAVSFYFRKNPVSATVYVSYTLDGVEFAGENVTFGENDSPVLPNAALVPSGYQLESASAESVHVDSNGVATPDRVTFNYTNPPITAEVTFRYVDRDGAQLFDDRRESLGQGANATAAYLLAAPEGYAYLSASAEEVFVDENRVPSTDTVVFTYERIPVTATVVFKYQDVNGNPLADERHELLGEGVYSASSFAISVPEGYNYVGVSAEQFEITAAGASPDTIVYTYELIPVSAGVTFKYLDASGNPIADERAEQLGEGVHSSSSYAIATPEGYNYVSVSAEQFEVTSAGASPDTIIFTYELIPVSAGVTFKYLDISGNPVSGERTEQLSEGVHSSSSYAIATPEGYNYISVSAEQFEVTATGASPDTIIFTYELIPVSASVTFKYLDVSGNPVSGERTEQLSEGVHSSSSYAIDVPEGYAYSGVSAEQIEITAAGASPDTVVFTYAVKEPEKKDAQIHVDYMDNLGGYLAVSADFMRGEGSYDAFEFGISTPEGYEPPAVSSPTVTVSADGVATPSTLTFTFTKTVVPIAKAQVTFRYVDDKGATLADDLVTELEEGPHDTAEFAAQPVGYTLQGATADSVTINPDGTANPAKVTFTYTANRTTATIEVHYTNAFGEDLPNSPQYVELSAGQHSVAPDTRYIPEGYVKSAESPESYPVTVSPELVPSPATVSFAYYQKSVTAVIQVHYIDSSTGKDLTIEQLELAPGQRVVEPNSSMIPNGYEMSAASPLTENVYVSEKGVASPQNVYFYYQPIKSEMYLGYAVTTQQTALRNQIDQSDSSILQTLPQGTLLNLTGQYTSGSVVWSGAQTVLGTNLQNGFVLDGATRHITKDEANAMMAEYERLHPTEPQQESGFYITRFNNVPLRETANSYASARFLAIDTVVYVRGQSYKDGVGWHITTYGGYTGYVALNQLRKLTTAEEDAYLSAQRTTAPTDTNTAAPYDPYAKSSYGYVTSSTVNFRDTPNGDKLKVLNKYAFALVLGTKEVNGVTWYNVNQSGTIGWIHGSYFHQLNLTELSSFLNSNEYKQGLLGNLSTNTNSNNNNQSGSTGSTSGGNNSSGSATAGNITSVEDWNVGTWKNTGVTTQVSYAPFNPYATASVTATVSPSATVSPTATFVIGTMIPITYTDESKETQTNSVPWGLIGVGVVLIGGAGGVYAYALNQNKKRKAAAARAAAARRANASVNGASGARADASKAASPYARRAVAAPPVAGSRQNDGTQNGANASNPYSRGTITGTDSAGSSNGTSSSAGAYGGQSNARGDYANGGERMSYDAGAAPVSGGNAYTEQPSAQGYNATEERGYTSTNAQGYEAEESPYGGQANGYTAQGYTEQPVAYTEPTAAPSAAPQPAQTGTNPYARPLGTGESASSPAARRSRRMERYRDAEDGSEPKE